MENINEENNKISKIGKQGNSDSWPGNGSKGNPKFIVEKAKKLPH